MGYDGYPLTTSYNSNCTPTYWHHLTKSGCHGRHVAATMAPSHSPIPCGLLRVGFDHFLLSSHLLNRHRNFRHGDDSETPSGLGSLPSCDCRVGMISPGRCVRTSGVRVVSGAFDFLIFLDIATIPPFFRSDAIH